MWPAVFDQQFFYLVAASISYVLPVVIALFRFGDFPSYHTWSAKLAALLIAPAFYLLLLNDQQLLFRAVIIFHVVVAIEEVAITFALKKSETNVASILSLLRKYSGKSK
jgi:CDP-diacylglycerol--glycerol-3-phosphate 3-phosphatidyltransferase